MKIQTNLFNSNKKINILFITLCFFICLGSSLETVNLSQLQNQVKLQWSFVSQIQHTWFKNIVNTYFKNCTQHTDLKALYNCKTTTQEYKKFWRQFISGIQQIKFGKIVEENDDHSWAKMMTQAAQEWITVNKTASIVQIQQAYEDISKFPYSLMDFAQFTQNYKDEFEDMKKLIKWQRQSKSYLTKKDRTEEQMKKDQTTIYKRFLDRKCFESQQAIQTCTMPLQRYTYYLKQLFFYYFDQPQKYSRFDSKHGITIIDPVLDYKITKLWRDMRGVMRQHLQLKEQVTLEQIQKLSPDILQSVMESLVRKSMTPKQHGRKNKQTQNNEL